MARPGRKPKPYSTIPVGFQLHENVDNEIDELARELKMHRNAVITMLVAERRGKKVEELLVPNRNNDDQGELRVSA